MKKTHTITMETLVKSMPIVEAPKDQAAFDAMLASANADLQTGSQAPCVRVKMGRPRKSEGSAPSVVKAVRLPVQLLEALQAAAQSQGLPLNAILQMASVEWLAHHGGH